MRASAVITPAPNRRARSLTVTLERIGAERLVARWTGEDEVTGFQLHFTPTGASWLYLAERWFAELSTKKIKRGAHTSVPGLERDIRGWIVTWNENPRPYVWVKTADQILGLARQILRAY